MGELIAKEISKEVFSHPHHPYYRPSALLPRLLRQAAPLRASQIQQEEFGGSRRNFGWGHMLKKMADCFLSTRTSIAWVLHLLIASVHQ